MGRKRVLHLAERDPTAQARDTPAPLEHDDRGDLLDTEPPYQIGPRVSIDATDAHTPALAHLEAGEHGLHPTPHP
jgi:hypothetical protein